MENRRAHARYEAEVVAELALDEDTLIGETRDISEGGCAVLLEATLGDGSEVGLSLVLTQEGIEDPDQEPWSANASVMWSAPTDDGRAMIGLRFSGLSPEQRRSLSAFLAALKRPGSDPSG